MKTTKQFIKEVKIRDKKRKHSFDYHKFNYTGSHNKSIIFCNKHKIEFIMNPNNRLNGQGCWKCGKENNIKPVKIREKNFLKKVQKLKYKYDYSKFIFFNFQTKSIVICKRHGEFLMAPKHLVYGSGCKSCKHEFSKFRRSSWVNNGENNLGIFYIIKCFNSKECFYKIGITYHSIYERYRKLTFMPYNYKIIKEINSYDLTFIWNLESKIKSKLRKQTYTPNIFFPGSIHECFLNIKDILKLI